MFSSGVWELCPAEQWMRIPTNFKELVEEVQNSSYGDSAGNQQNVRGYEKAEAGWIALQDHEEYRFRQGYVQ